MLDPETAASLSGEARKQLINEEQPIHPLFAYLYVADKYEGMILVNAATLLDGDPLNNYLKRALDPARYPKGAFNPGGALTRREQHNDRGKLCLHHDSYSVGRRQHRSAAATTDSADD